MKIVIGTGQPDPPEVTLDIDALVYSKALLQANSGGGKSGLIRVIVEKTIPHIPTIIIDPEGEFSTLREKFDIVLVGEGGELEADPRSAGLLARKLVELGASAVLDIYELKPAAKHQFVKTFLESLMALPRSLWRPTFIVIDEAQMFAPESGMGSSEALDAVSDLLFRGRKRGFGTILATPRLSMLHKNVAGANNIFIGRTNLDTDQVRCGKALGKTTKEAVELRMLKPRQFYAYGPDLNVDGVTLFRVADCQTTIRKPGDRKSLKPPKASHVVEQLADQLKDIKQEAEKEIRDLNDAKTEIAALSRKLKAAERNQSPRERDTTKIADLERLLADERAKVKPDGKPKVIEKRIMAVAAINRLEGLLEKAAAIPSVVEELRAVIRQGKELNTQELSIPAAPEPARKIFEPGFARPSIAAVRPRETTGARSVASSNGDGPANITGGALRILQVLASKPDLKLTKPQLGTLAKMKHTGGSFSTYMSRLRSAGFISADGQFIQITDAGIDFIGADRLPEPLTSEEVLQQWLSTPAISGGAANMLKVLFNLRREGRGLSRSELAEAVNMEASGGSFSTYLSRLRSNGLIQEQGGVIFASDTLFINE